MASIAIILDYPHFTSLVSSSYYSFKMSVFPFSYILVSKQIEVYVYYHIYYNFSTFCCLHLIKTSVLKWSQIQNASNNSDHLENRL